MYWHPHDTLRFALGEIKGPGLAVEFGVGTGTTLKIIAEIGPEANSTTMLATLVDLQRSDPYPGVRDAARQAYAKVQRKN